MYMLVRACVHLHACVRVPSDCYACGCLCMHVPMCARVHTGVCPVFCVHLCMFVHACAHVPTCVCLALCAFILLHACVYVCVCLVNVTCVHACAYICVSEKMSELTHAAHEVKLKGSLKRQQVHPDAGTLWAAGPADGFWAVGACSRLDVIWGKAEAEN